MRRVCAPPRTDSLTHQHDLDCDFACVLRKLSRDSQRSFSSLSFWHYFQVLVQNFLRLRRASVNFLSRLGPGSSPGRAESQLASELGELPLLGRRRACGAAAAVALSRSHSHRPNAARSRRAAGAAGRRSKHTASTSAAPPPPQRQQPMAIPPPPCRRRRCRLCCCCRSVSSVSACAVESCVHTVLKNWSNVWTWRAVLAGARA